MNQKSFNLFESFDISLSHVLSYQTKFCAFFLKFINKYFTLFDAIITGIFLTPFSD